MARDDGHDLQRTILDTARHALVSDGYQSLSMRRIAKAIGYSATSIYLHFENKDQLVHALIDEGVEMLHDRLRETADGEIPRAELVLGAEPLDRLLRLSRAYVRFGLENPEYYEIMYVLHPEYMERYPAEKYRKARQNLLIVADSIRAGMESGVIEDVEPLEAASIIWAQLHGIVTLLNYERVDKRLDPESYAEAACRRIIRGFASEPQTEPAS